MKRKHFTHTQLSNPKNRAEYILDMLPSMRGEVLYQFEQMAKGGGGEKIDGSTLREQHYRWFSDTWFKEVLAEVKRLRGLIKDYSDE